MIVISNLIFIGSDIAAVQSGFFKFTNPDLFGLPYWEFFAWGFWILYMYRLLPKHFPTNLHLATVIGTICFSQSFGLIENREILLIVSVMIILISMKFLNTINDFLYLGYLAAVGMVVETTGLYFNLWSYPHSNLIVAATQFVVMWAGVGLFFRNLIGPFLFVPFIKPHVIRNVFSKNSVLTSPLIEAKSGLHHSYSDYLKIAESATEGADTRKAIESLREALYSAQNPMERARAHLLLSQTYRTVIQMRNARKEIEAAFLELKLDIPRNFLLQTLKTACNFLKDYFTKYESSPNDELLKLKVALYVEIGLAGYYSREDALMVQASLRGYVCAKKLGPSIEMINWYGGTICVLILKGKHKIANYLKKDAEKMLGELNSPDVNAKWNIWQAIAIDYSGDSKKSVQLFEHTFQTQKNHLHMHDLRLGVFTMCCNYLLRGHFEKSTKALDYLFEENINPQCSYFSHTGRFIDWYKIGPYSFLMPDSGIEENLRFSRAIFSQQDEEKWAITQYLGNLLFNIYNNGQELALTDEVELRFTLLKLSPQNTYIEAAFFWVGLTLVRLAQFENKLLSEKDMKRLMGKIKKMPNHPILNQHRKILEERFNILTSNISTYELDENFLNELNHSDNELAKLEYHKNKMLYLIKNKKVNATFSEDYIKLLTSTGWSQYISMNLKWMEFKTQELNNV